MYFVLVVFLLWYLGLCIGIVEGVGSGVVCVVVVVVWYCVGDVGYYEFVWLGGFCDGFGYLFGQWFGC